MGLPRFLPIVTILAVLAVPASADVSTNPLSAPKGAYELSNSHSLVTFCISHLGISNYCGWFPKLSGTLHFNGAQPDKSRIEVAIDLATVQSRSAELDRRLRDELFEVVKFGTATFKSSGVSVTGANRGDIAGELTLHGVTRPVVLRTTFNGGRPSPIGPGYLIGFSADATIKLADFGLTSAAWTVFVGEEVAIHIESEFVHEQ